MFLFLFCCKIIFLIEEKLQQSTKPIEPVEPYASFEDNTDQPVEVQNENYQIDRVVKLKIRVSMIF